MRIYQLFWWSGPLVARDVIGGISGIAVAAVAVIAGCAFASAGNLAWFLFFGLLGASSLRASLPQLRRVSHLCVVLDPVDEPDTTLPLAA